MASITIDSVSTVNSTCSNNGSATVYAHSNPPGVLFYAIVSGPVLSPVQNNNTFSSLYPGSYTARIYDVNFDSLETQFQVGGNYQLPRFDLVGINPTCTGFTDGSITAIPDTAFGLAPYMYQVMAPFAGSPQAQNYFPALPDNSYEIRMTDACGNYQTRFSTLIASGTGLVDVPYDVGCMVYKTGCDTLEVTSYIYLFKEKDDLPLTITYNTPFGAITKQLFAIPLDTLNMVPGFYMLKDTVPNLTYGDFLQVQVSDTCGQSVFSYYTQVAPFDWDLYYYATTVNCVATFTATAMLKAPPVYPYHYTYGKAILSFTLVDLATNLLVDSGSCVGTCSPYLKSEIPGNIYRLTITDGCNEVWQKDIVWPTAAPPLVNIYNTYACRDSSTSLYFECLGFESSPVVHFISGPANVQSSKPHFEYSDTITYPRYISGLFGQAFINIRDCPAGFYVFEVFDSCGNVVQGSFTVDPNMLTSLDYEWDIKASCLNNNTLYYNFNKGTPMAVYASITGIGNNYFYEDYYPSPSLDSVTNLSVGQYALVIDYAIHNGSGTAYDASLVNDTMPSCWTVHDTITILPYTNSSFLTNNTVYCNGINYVELIPDTSRGVPPYQFAIISGPQTFPLQDSAIFQIQQFGNYLVSMEDVCGNNYTQQITVSSDSFPPIVKVGFFCDGNYASLQAVSSAYFTYTWQYPTGNIVTGDSISFSPFTVADTGWYHVTKIVNINGCNDTLETNYYLSPGDSVMNSFSFCEGDSVQVGSQVYYLPGTYHNTFLTANGCDSVVVTTISFLPLSMDSSSVSICNGDSVLVGSNYYSQQGNYVDTIADGVLCKKIMFTHLSVITIVDSISASICKGDKFMVGNAFHEAAGVFNDTLTSATGCDSVVITTLSLKPITYFTITSDVDTVASGSDVSLTCNYQQALEYEWMGDAQFNSVNSFATIAMIDSSVWIYLSVTDTSGCRKRDSIYIYVRETNPDTCDESLSISLPNVFTPNNDGINDYFLADIKDVEMISLIITNRWGNIVFESTDINFRWDGANHQNEPLASSTYYYALRYYACDDHHVKYKRGSVTLIR